MNEILTFKLHYVEEDELGELKIRHTKRFQIGWQLMLPSLKEMEEWIIRSFEAEMEEVKRIEDQRVFDAISEILPEV